jgi:hypothetical protein
MTEQDQTPRPDDDTTGHARRDDDDARGDDDAMGHMRRDADDARGDDDDDTTGHMRAR